MLDLHQVHRLLVAERSRDIGVITAAVNDVLATSPEVSPLDIEMVFRDAGSPVYLIGKPELTIVISMPAWRQRARSARHVAARKPLRAGGHHGPFMTRGGRRERATRSGKNALLTGADRRHTGRAAAYAPAVSALRRGPRIRARFGSCWRWHQAWRRGSRPNSRPSSLQRWARRLASAGARCRRAANVACAFASFSGCG